jgi:N-acetylated-alpha-linked acidic dipeptidase
MKQERALTTARGLPGRPWFRHQVFAPGLVTGYAVQFLPGMRDAIDQGNEEIARIYRDLLIDSLREAARLAERAT